MQDEFGAEAAASVVVPEPGVPQLFPISDHLMFRKELAARVYGESYALDLHLGMKHSSVVQAGALFHLEYPAEPVATTTQASSSGQT